VKEEKRAFVYSGRFDCTRGQEFWVDNEIVFPHEEQEKVRPEESPDGFYRTVVGPSVPHTGVTYCNCNPCVRLAMRRLTCVRSPAAENDNPTDPPGTKAREIENEFRTNQREFINRDDVKTILDQWLTHEHFEDYEDVPESIKNHAHRPHPKMRLRVACRTDLESSGEIQERLFLKSVLYKMKKEEIGKIGKFPRMIGDLGVAASLQGFYLTEIIKHAMGDTAIECNGMECDVIIDPRPETLTRVFQKLIDPPGRGYFALYSDDSCLSVRIDGVVRMFNLDIASCDTSHTGQLFHRLRDLCPASARDDVDKLIEQCTLPIRVLDVNDANRQVHLQPNEPTLYSGSTLTTIINCLANVLIFLAIATRDIKAPEDISAAAKTAGYVVTGTDPSEECNTYHSLQFLKHSPVYDTSGRLRPMKNLGVLLRSMGSCKRDLPGRGCLRARGRSFMKGFLHGTYPTQHFTFINTLKSHFEGAIVDSDMARFIDTEIPHTVAASTEHWSVDDDEYLARYELTGMEQDEMNELAKYAVLETTIECEAITKILQKDYGLNTQTR